MFVFGHTQNDVRLMFTQTNFPTPPTPPTIANCERTTNATAIFSGPDSTIICANTTAGYVTCEGSEGQTPGSLASYLTGLRNIQKIAFADQSACYLRADTSIGCIGSNAVSFIVLHLS